ncbi:MAG: oxygenase MpaB family protein [Limisphaerales bacterium]
MDTSTSRWSDEFLNQMRQEGDSLADDTVRQLFEHSEVGAVNRLLIQLVRNDEVPPVGLPPEVYAYLERVEALPDIDDHKVERAQRLFMDHGNLALAILLCASLPECYVMRNAVKVLVLTQKLDDHTFRRLLETCQFLMAVMSPGGLSPGGKGIRSAQKVRLMHAAIRHLILHPNGRAAMGEAPKDFSEVLGEPGWDVQANDYPLNQTVMTYTLLTFGYVIPRGWEAMGVTLTPEDKDAFVHCWTVVGQIMGLRQQLMPANYAEAEILFHQIKAQEAGPSPEGIVLTDSLLKCIRGALPADLAPHLPAFAVHHLVGEETAVMVGVRRPNLAAEVLGQTMFRVINLIAWVKRETQQDLVLAPRVWNWLSHRLIERLTNLGQPPGWNRHIFKIPEELAASWQPPET